MLCACAWTIRAIDEQELGGPSKDVVRDPELADADPILKRPDLQAAHKAKRKAELALDANKKKEEAARKKGHMKAPSYVFDLTDDDFVDHVSYVTWLGENAYGLGDSLPKEIRRPAAQNRFFFLTLKDVPLMQVVCALRRPFPSPGSAVALISFRLRRCTVQVQTLWPFARPQIHFFSPAALYLSFWCASDLFFSPRRCKVQV